MQDIDRKAFFQSWSAAWEQCGRTVTDTQLRFAFECLRDFSLADTQRALLQHARDPDVGQHPPKPADIVRQIKGGSEDNATTAWGKVMQALQHGPYAVIVFDDPAIHAALESVSWAALCRCTYADLPFRQRDFEAAYRANVGTEHFPASVCAVPLDRMPDPVVIGDPDQAQRVHALGYDRSRQRPQQLTAAETAQRLLA